MDAERSEVGRRGSPQSSRGREITPKWFQNAELNQRYDQCGVEQRNPQVSKQVTAGIRSVLFGKKLLGAFVHQNKARDICQPVADNQAPFECPLVEKTDDPRKGYS